MKKILIAVVAVALMLAGCTKNTSLTESRQVLIMYLVADNNLFPDITENVRQVTQGVGKEFAKNSRILIMFDGGSNGTTLREVVPPQKTGEPASLKVLVKYPSLNSTDPAVMQKVLNDIRIIAPAEHYGIILASHGTGWYPKELVNLTSQKGPASGGVSHPQVAGEHDLSELFESNNTRWFGIDNDDWTGKSSMSIDDMVAGMSPIHFDFIMFDACLMASVELAYALRNSADYLLAAPSEVMQPGFPYHLIINDFFNREISIKNRLGYIAQKYINYYETQSVVSKSATIALIQLSEMEALAETVKKIYAYPENNSVNPWNVMVLDRLSSSNVFFDLDDYMKRLSGSDQLYNSFVEQYGRTILYVGHTTIVMGLANSNVSGMSTYIVRTQFPITADYWYATEWAKRVGD